MNRALGALKQLTKSSREKEENGDSSNHAPWPIRSALSRIWESLEAANKMRACLSQLDRLHPKKRPERLFCANHPPNRREVPLPRHRNYRDGKRGDRSTRFSYLGRERRSRFRLRFDRIRSSPSHAQPGPFPRSAPHPPQPPVYLLWAEDVEAFPELLRKLAALTHRVIFDSEVAQDLPSFARSALKLQEEGDLSLADLNWARLEPWRSLLLLSFPHPENFEELRRAKQITISYDGSSSHFFCPCKNPPDLPPRVDRLPTRLEAHKNRAQGEILFLYEGGQQILLKKESLSALEPGAILSIEITSTKEHTFSFTRSPNLPDQIQIKCSTPSRCELPTYYLFSKRELGQSLVREIYHPGTSSHFITLLKHLSSLQSIC